MSAINTNFSVHSGSAPTIQFPIVGYDKKPLNITGATIIMCLHVSTDPESSYLWNKSVAIVNAALGIAQISLTAADTHMPGQHYFETRMTDATGTILTIAYGVMNILQSGF